MKFRRILQRMKQSVAFLGLVFLAVPSFCDAESPFASELSTMYGKKDYQRAVLDEEKAIIADVIHKLATLHEFTLLRKKSDLDKTGKKIDHIHPLRQLLCVLTDETVKADFRKMSKRSLVWKSYAEKLGEVLALEADKGNLTNWQMEDFAATLQISPDMTRSYLSQRRWRTFLDWLIGAVPR